VRGGVVVLDLRRSSTTPQGEEHADAERDGPVKFRIFQPRADGSVEIGVFGRLGIGFQTPGKRLDSDLVEAFTRLPGPVAESPVEGTG
jgi:hypothetical protein